MSNVFITHGHTQTLLRLSQLPQKEGPPYQISIVKCLQKHYSVLDVTESWNGYLFQKKKMHLNRDFLQRILATKENVLLLSHLHPG